MYFGKEVRVILRFEAKEAYLLLQKRNDKEAKSILKSIDRVIEKLKSNPQYGDCIRKKNFPLVYDKQDISNLYRVELSNYWRLVYTIQGSSVEIFLFVLSISDHKDYNKLFGYE